jgi:hypothetical protein
MLTYVESQLYSGCFAFLDAISVASLHTVMAFSSEQ